MPRPTPFCPHHLPVLLPLKQAASPRPAGLLKWPAAALPLTLLKRCLRLHDSPTPITKEDWGGGAWRRHVIVPRGRADRTTSSLGLGGGIQNHKLTGSAAPTPPGRSAELLGDLAALPADLRTLRRDLVHGEWYLGPANCRRSACCERKCFSDDQSAARSRFNVPPSSTPPSPLSGFHPLRLPSALPSSTLPGHRRPRSRFGVRPRPLMAVWPAPRLVSLGLEP